MNAPSAPVAMEVANRQAAAVQALRPGASMADQNSRAVTKKLRCWAACQASLFRAGSKREGRGQPHSPTACSTVATRGSETTAQMAAAALLRGTAARTWRAGAGKA